MTRLRPANIRQTSGTLSYAYDGISNYYYSNQLKQNLANANALKALGRKLVCPIMDLKPGKLHTLQPASLPISIQLRTQKTMQLILAHSCHWILNKAHQFASVHMCPKTSKVFEIMAGLNFKVPAEHYVLEDALFAVAKNFENLCNIAPKAKHVNMRKKQGLTKLYKQYLKGFYSAKSQQVFTNKPKLFSLNRQPQLLNHKKTQSKRCLTKTFEILNHNILISKHNMQVIHSEDNLCLSSGVNLVHHRSKAHCLLAYKKTKPLLHPNELLVSKCHFNNHPKQKFMNLAFSYLGTKTYHNKSKRFIGPRLAAMHGELHSYGKIRKKQAHYYDFQFLKQLKKNAPLKFDFVSPLSKLSVAMNKQKVKDPWVILSTSTPFYQANRQKQSSIKSRVDVFMDSKNEYAVFKTRDVPKLYHPNHSVHISQAEQKAVDTINPRFVTLGRFNRPLKLGLFAFIEGKFPRGISQGYKFGVSKLKLKSKGVNSWLNKNKVISHKKSKRKHCRTKTNCDVNGIDLKLTPFTYSLRYSNWLKVGLSRLNTALRFELILNLEQMAENPHAGARLRSTLSVRV